MPPEPEPEPEPEPPLPCASSPCQNSTGACVDDEANAAYTCVCAPGWGGDACGTPARVTVLLTLDMEFRSVSYPSGERRFRGAFLNDVAALLSVPASRIVYSSVAEGSVIGECSNGRVGL